MAMYDTNKAKMSATILEKVFKQYPNYEGYSDLTLLHNLSFLKTVAMHKEQQNFTKFDTEIEKIGSKLLSIDSSNPYANYYMAEYYRSKDSNDVAHKYYQNIVNAKNYSKSWYTTEAVTRLKEHKKDK